jgi:hypothetical protein
MPVFAQTCRRGPTEARPQDPISESIRRSGSGPEYREEVDAGYYDVSNLQNAVDSAIKIRELQTANIDKYLAATGKSGRHLYAGTNRTIPVGATNGAKTGYITDKGLFKPWASDDLMRKSSGKYGCPVIAQGTEAQPLTGYTYPTSGSAIYVGAATIRQASDPTDTTPAIFVGSDMTTASGNLIPACGNEGINVQVVYPGKATGVSYVGTYNVGTVSSTGYELQDDIKNITFQKCMERAEDKGMSLFSYTANKCYINKNSRSDATSAGLGLELKPANPSSLPGDYRGGQQLLHFGKDGTLNVLNSREPTSAAGKVLYKFGLETAISQCDFKDGGVIMKIGGSWGLNCNDIIKYNTQDEKLYDGYRSNNGTHQSSLLNIMKTKKVTTIRYESSPNDRVTPNSFCNIEMGEACGKDDKPQTYNEWLRLGGSCPNRAYRPASRCTTGCERKSTELFTIGKWFCA